MHLLLNVTAGTWESCHPSGVKYAGVLALVIYKHVLTVLTSGHIKLIAITNYHKKTPYNLVSPYFQQVAPFLLTHSCDQPSLLAAACKFMSVRPHDFIARNLNRTLPVLFAETHGKVLEVIAQETGQKVSTLFLNNSHEILAFVLRIQAPVQSNKALQFIINILREAAGDNRGSIDMPTIIRSCILQLLAELVVGLGDENPDEVGAVNSISLANESLI